MRSLVVFLTVLSLVGFLLLLWTFVEYLDWSSGISSTAPRLTFNAFEKLYVLNPSKWNFYPSYVRYYPEDEIGCDCCDMAMKANDFCSRGERREVIE